MADPQEPTPAALQDADSLFFQPIIEKNQWLIRIRCIYPFFVLAFLFVYRPLAPLVSFLPIRVLTVFLLPLVGNLVFAIDFKKRVKRVTIHSDYGQLNRYLALQLDFDLMVIFLSIYLPQMIDSPLVNLFFLYVILSSFLISQAKALRNLSIGVVLLAVGMMGQRHDFYLQPREITYLVTMIMLFFFTFLISSFLSRSLRKNEELLQKLLRHSHELSISDGLTGLYNQTYFFESLENEAKFSQRHGHHFSLIMMDVDYFKNYNDHNGHLHGSAALKRIGQIMRKVFRTTDFLAKYGGDEFVVMLPQTEKVGAYLAAERFREAVENEPLPGAEHQPHGRITISLGIASFPEHTQSKEEIVEKADKALYLAKEMGRNRTVIYHEGMEADEEY